MSDTHHETNYPDDYNNRPWWGLPCTITPCFGARLVQEGNRLYYLADRAGIRGRFSDADAYHLDQAFPLLMKQLELMLTSGELNPRHQHTVTLLPCRPRRYQRPVQRRGCVPSGPGLSAADETTGTHAHQR